MSPRQIALLLLAAAPLAILADLPTLGRALPFIAMLAWGAADLRVMPCVHACHAAARRDVAHLNPSHLESR